MATVQTLNKRGATRIRREARSMSLSRDAVLTGFTTTGDARLTEALDAVGLPAIGDPLPGSPLLALVSLEPEFQTDGSVIVRQNYAWQPTDIVGELAFAQVYVGAEFSQVQTTKDRNGSRLQVYYTYPPATTAGMETEMFPTWAPDLAGKTQHQMGMVSIEVAEPTIRFVRNEVMSPLYMTRLFANKTNLAGWMVDPAAAAGTWRCVQCEATGAFGKFWQFSYAFKYREDGWNPEYVFMVNGKSVPIGTATGDGTAEFAYDGRPNAAPSIRHADEYAQVDFNQLNLPMIDNYPPFIT